MKMESPGNGVFQDENPVSEDHQGFIPRRRNWLYNQKLISSDLSQDSIYSEDLEFMCNSIKVSSCQDQENLKEEKHS